MLDDTNIPHRAGDTGVTDSPLFNLGRLLGQKQELSTDILGLIEGARQAGYDQGYDDGLEVGAAGDKS